MSQSRTLLSNFMRGERERERERERVKKPGRKAWANCDMKTQMMKLSSQGEQSGNAVDAVTLEVAENVAPSFSALHRSC